MKVPPEDSEFREADRMELQRFRKKIKTATDASLIEREEGPKYNRELQVYAVHMWAPPPNFVDVAQDTFHFNEKAAADKAIKYAESLLE